MRDNLNNSGKLTDSKEDKIYMFDVLNRDSTFLLNSCINDRNGAITRMLLLISISSIIYSLFKNEIIQFTIIICLIAGGVFLTHTYKKYDKEVLKIKSGLDRDKRKYLEEML